MFPTLCFYDVTTGSEQTDGSGSYYNEAEAQLVVLLIQALIVEGIEACRIGVITLYKAQMYKIITSLHTDKYVLQSLDDEDSAAMLYSKYYSLLVRRLAIF